MKKLVIFIIFVFYCTFLCGCNLFKKSEETIINLIEKEINIVISDEFELEEQYSSNIFMHGRLPFYYIFKANCEPTAFLYNYGFTKNDSVSVEDDIIDTLLKENEAYNLRIPDSSLIDFSNDYLLVYKKDDYCLIYYVDLFKLIIFIEAT